MGPTFLRFFREPAQFYSPFTTRIGIRGTHSRLNPWVPMGGGDGLKTHKDTFLIKFKTVNYSKVDRRNWQQVHAGPMVHQKLHNKLLTESLIESITTLWKGQGNPIRVSMICNPRRGLSSRGYCKSWTRGWDSLVPSTMWWLIIFLPRLLFLINNPNSTSF